MVNQETYRRIRLLILDEMELFRISLSRYLALQPGFEVAGECGDSKTALDIISVSPVDVVLLDLHLADEEADELIAAMCKGGYRGKFLIVAGTVAVQGAAAVIKSGASGIFLKSDASDRLIQAIRLVAEGAVWIDPKIMRLMADRLLEIPPQSENGPVSHLTDRERYVLSGIVDGFTNRKIGDRLGVSEGAIKASVQQLFTRAGVRTRSQLVRVALEGLLGDACPSGSSAVGQPIRRFSDGVPVNSCSP